MSGAPKIPVSIVVGMRNSATTILLCLDGLVSQEYPIAEIIVIDNVSTDNSVALVEAFALRSPVPVRLVKQTVNGGLATSYNTGASMAVAPLLVLVHSDGTFPSTRELEKLTAPLCEDQEAVASYPKLLMPREVWERFPYWQKHLFARAMGREIPSMCGKFDCIRKEAYVRAGGFDTKRFTAACGYGGEDADAHHRISRLGRTVESEARVIHLHDLSSRYGLRALFATRKMLARTYAKVLHFQGFQPTPGKLSFFIRPVLSVLPFVPRMHLAGVLLLAAFSLANSWRMYASRSTLFNLRILLVPLVDAALVYHEAFWFLEGLVTPPADAKGSG